MKGRGGGKALGLFENGSLDYGTFSKNIIFNTYYILRHLAVSARRRSEEVE